MMANPSPNKQKPVRVPSPRKSGASKQNSPTGSKLDTLSGYSKWKSNQCAKLDPSPRGASFEVYCNTKVGRLHRKKFGSGSRGKCIESNGGWFTPNEFEELGGRGSNKSWKQSLRYGAKRSPLGCLLDAKVLVEHRRCCSCSSCSGSPSNDRVKYLKPRSKSCRPSPPAGVKAAGGYAVRETERQLTPAVSVSEPAVVEEPVETAVQPTKSVAVRLEELESLAHNFITSSIKFTDMVTSLKVAMDPLLKGENEQLRKDLEKERTQNEPLRAKIKQLECMLAKQALVVLSDERKKKKVGQTFCPPPNPGPQPVPVLTHDAVVQTGPSSPFRPPWYPSDAASTLQQESVSSTGVHPDVRREIPSPLAEDSLMSQGIDDSGMDQEEGDHVFDEEEVEGEASSDGAVLPSRGVAEVLRCIVCNKITDIICARCKIAPFCSEPCRRQGEADHTPYCDEAVAVAAATGIDLSRRDAPMEVERTAGVAVDQFGMPGSVAGLVVQAGDEMQDGTGYLLNGSLGEGVVGNLVRIPNGVHGQSGYELRGVDNDSEGNPVAYVIVELRSGAS